MFGSNKTASSILNFMFKLDTKYKRLFNYLLSRKINSAKNLDIHPSAQLSGYDHISIGDNFHAGICLRLEAVTNYNTSVYNPRIVIKNNVTINDFVHIGCTNYVEIGNNVLMASKIYISDHNHGTYAGLDQTDPRIPPAERIVTNDKQVLINDNVWIGESVSILPGVTVGEGSIIGANSVVNRDVPPFSIAVGSPAKVVKQYDFKLKKWTSV